MRCQQIQELLSAYLDGEVEPSQQAKIKAHLEDCATCRYQWEDLVASVTLLRGLPGVSPPESFREQLLHKLEGRRIYAPRRRFRLGWPKFIAAAAILVVVFSLTSVWAGHILPQNLWPWHKGRDTAPSINVADRSLKKEVSTAPSGLRPETLEPGTGSSKDGDGYGEIQAGGEGDRAGTNYTLREGNGKGGELSQRANIRIDSLAGRHPQSGGVVKEKVHADPPPAASRQNVPELMAFSSPETTAGGQIKRAAGTSRSGSNGGLRAKASGKSASGAPRAGMAQEPGDSPGGDEVRTGVKTVKEFVLILEVLDISKAREEVLNLVQKYNALVGPEEPEGQSKVMIVISNEYWPGFREELKSLGQVKGSRTNFRDITLEYNGLVKNLNLLKEKEKELLSSTGSDLTELERVQGEIRKTTGQLHALSEAAQKTTVELVLCANSSCQQDQLQVK
ncbi:hypothetical protein J2Z49_002290 [Desulfofundulus luciae]|uniref:Anti-sigma-W factor RsiW n=1 Tax=Desulfofundulus luciae TaxID=74702 RepID=A0ABU0B381_9FIRM|nr:anti-sigma factor [Desulfofundulus luciae]MDQ0287171.1 hypothetical protein [Desulfofundulus luciae]